MKRIALFLLTNIAVLAVITIVLKVLGLDQVMWQQGMPLGPLLAFSAVVGFAGSIISLLMSKPMAKWSTGAQVIDGSEGTTQRWLVETVRRLAAKAGIGMPEVAMYEGEPNAFATGAFKNCFAGGGFHRASEFDEPGRGRGSARPRGRACRER